MPSPPAVNLSSTTTTTAAAAPRSAAEPHHSAFRTFLSELNPLQYIPVIGGIYRAVTGDTIPETARTVGSFVVSALTGGPIGVAMNVAALAVEKAVGVDPEKLEQHMLASIGLGGPHPAAPAVAKPVEVAATKPASHEILAAPAAWSRAQLLAYGVTTTAQGTLKRGETTGSDVLNDLELARHTTAAHVYATAELAFIPRSQKGTKIAASG